MQRSALQTGRELTLRALYTSILQTQQMLAAVDDTWSVLEKR
jgi:hypothetical protein